MLFSDQNSTNSEQDSFDELPLGSSYMGDQIDAQIEQANKLLAKLTEATEIKSKALKFDLLQEKTNEKPQATNIKDHTTKDLAIEPEDRKDKKKVSFRMNTIIDEKSLDKML